ncbi:MAG: hypothetical protein Kow00109_09170 [Acidobacteriota bacterium]
MTSLRLLVYLRESPAGDSPLVPTRDGCWIDEERLSWEPAEADAAALAWALQLRASQDSQLTVCALGPPRLEALLRRTALALGADRAIHVVDERGLRSSPAERAWFLAALAERERADLVLLGAYSDDWGTGVTAPFAARFLGWPVALQAVELCWGDPPELEVVCEAGAGERRLEHHRLPLVVSILPGRIGLPHPPLKGILNAKKRPVERLRPDELPAPPDRLPRITVTALRPLERRRECRMIHDVEEGIAAFLALLRQVREASPPSSGGASRAAESPRAEDGAFSPGAKAARGGFRGRHAAWIDTADAAGRLETSGAGSPARPDGASFVVIRLGHAPQEPATAELQPVSGSGAQITLAFTEPVASSVEAAACALARLAREGGWSLLMFPPGPRSEDLAPLLAAKLDACLLRGYWEGPPPATSPSGLALPLFRGKLIAGIEVPSEQPVVAVLEGSPPPLFGGASSDQAPRGGAGTVIPVDRYRCRWPVAPCARRLDPAPERVDFRHAAVVLGVGRGVTDEDLFARVARLADLLDAELAGSRPVIDRGWLPRERQVGSSGQWIRPALYLALGVSGAYQHMAGVMEAGTIVAVNRDPHAPVFRMADVGIVARVEDFIRRLEARLARGDLGSSAN